MKITSLAKQPLRVQIGTPQWIDSEVKQYLLTGKYDSFFTGWPGSNHFDAATQGMEKLRTALLVETMRRSDWLQFSTGVPDDLYAWSSNKLRPMVRGLFCAEERAAVLHLLASNIVFLTPANLVTVLQSERWLSTAWDVANIYLESLAVPTLSAQARNIVGLSQEERCYVSMAYFQETDPFADFVVHEAAHVFHNCRRSTAGLRHRSRSDYLLDVDYRMRETFAWACEAWSRITSIARRSSDREILLRQHAEHGLPADDRVDHDEYLDILVEATKARSGWQKIFSRCAA
jgi:hypothetical protein